MSEYAKIGILYNGCSSIKRSIVLDMVIMVPPIKTRITDPHYHVKSGQELPHMQDFPLLFQNKHKFNSFSLQPLHSFLDPMPDPLSLPFYPLSHIWIHQFPPCFSILFTSIVLLLIIKDHCTCGKWLLDRDLFSVTFYLSCKANY